MRAQAFSDLLTPNGLWVFFAVLGFLPVLLQNPFIIDTLFLALLFGYTATAWNILGGYTGQISLGHAAFFGLGAYTSTLLFNFWQISPWIGMLSGGFLAGCVSLLLGYACFRFGIRGHYFALFTIGFGEIARILFNEIEIFGAAVGLSIDLALQKGIWVMQFSSTLPFYYIIFSMSILLVLFVRILERSRLGHWFKAVRDDPNSAEALGVNTFRVKMVAIFLSALFTGFAGTVYAGYYSYIHPDSVAGILLSIRLAIIAIIGGMGYAHGPLVGAFLIYLLSTSLRVIIDVQYGAALDTVIYGLLLIVMILFMPEGLSRTLGTWSRKMKDAQSRQIG
jgi:branched-chain amino acid transport system permease protein